MATTDSSGRGRLRPRARLLRTLGNDLISNDKVAIIELVKNSFDADAQNVVVRFVGPLTPTEGRIEVWDDGTGMDAETVESAWLEIATDNKQKRTHSAGGRRVLGEKGIGRLASARIGSELSLITRREDAQEVQLLVDWSDFDREGAFLDEIDLAWEIGSSDLFAPNGAANEIFSSNAEEWHAGSGTLLRIEKLNRSWTEEDVAELRTSLTRLVRPRPAHLDSPGSDFTIHLDFTSTVDELEKFSGSVQPPQDFQQPHYRLSGVVDESGVATLRYEQLAPEVDETLDERALWVSDRRAPLCGGFQFELSVWDRDRQGFDKTVAAAERSGTALIAANLRGFRADLNDVAGVSVYRDGFRVLPFGEKDDDWLRLDIRRVQNPTLAVSNNQIIGHVFIAADGNPLLRDQSNREGLLDGPAYDDLRSIIRAALSMLEVRRYASRPRAEKPASTRGGLFDRFELTTLRDAIEAKHPGDKQIMGLLDEKDRAIQAGVEEVQQVLSRYSRLATLGSLVDNVLHDGRTIVAQIIARARIRRRELTKEATPCQDRLQVADEALARTMDQANQIDQLFGRIEPFGGRKRGRPRRTQIAEILERAVAIHRVDAEERGIDLSADVDDFEVTVDESEMLTVLANLIGNALYWTSTNRPDSPKKVRVSAVRNADASLSVFVGDTGPGVEDDVRDLIFDPYFSTKPDGIGLGLSIAGSLVQDVYDGDLRLVDNVQFEGATFEAIFRRRS